MRKSIRCSAVRGARGGSFERWAWRCREDEATNSGTCSQYLPGTAFGDEDTDSLKCQRQPMDKKDHMWMRGENISFVRLTEVCQADDLPYFIPHFLGDKCPLFDILVELVGAGEKTPYFFAQVKSTRLGYSKKSNRLRVEVSKDDVVRMVNYPAPTYVIGIDEKGEKAFIVAVVPVWARSSLPSVPPTR
jgi:hypothetical protein